MTLPDKNHLTIRCPSCSQKFKVGAELMGRTVECGGCESRFSVTDDVIQKIAKHYPGERNLDALAGFARVKGEKIGVSAATPIPRGPHEAGYFSPISKVGPFRLTLGWIGALLVLATSFILMSEKLVKDIALHMQIAIAVGVGVLALVLLVFANPRNHKRAILVGGLASVILLSLPFVFRSKAGNEPFSQSAVSIEETTSDAESHTTGQAEKEMLNQIGIKPLEIEVRRLSEADSKLRAYGIWLRGMSESNRLSVRDYLLRSTNASSSSVIYPRGERSYLMVLTGLDQSIDEVAEIVAKIGEHPVIHKRLGLIEINIDASVFIEGPLEKLTNKSNPAFYSLNKRELESIQLDRVKKAVKRLSDAEPKIYRSDITRLLVLLIAMPQVDFPEEVCQALLVWAENPAAANTPVLNRLKKMHSEKRKIPKSMVELLAKGKELEAIPIAMDLWQHDATTWESILQEFGPAIEPNLLSNFNDLEATLRHSATRMLARVGTSKSIPVLEAGKKKADPELLVLIDNAIHSIKERN